MSGLIYPWETADEAALRHDNPKLWMRWVMSRPLGWKSLSQPNHSPIASVGYKQEEPCGTEQDQ